MLRLIESVLLLYFVPLILDIRFVGWMFFITVDTFDVIISNFSGTIII